MRWPLLLLPCLACGPDVADEMERALRLSNDAIAFGLLASEGVAWVDARPPRGKLDATWPSKPGNRHAPAGDCPQLTRVPADGEPFVTTAAYIGCVSGSRLTPVVLQGGLVIEGTEDEADVDFADLTVASSRIPVGGPLKAERVGGDRLYAITGVLTMPETPLLAEITGTYRLNIDHSATQTVGLDGFVDLDTDLGPARVTLRKVVLHLDDIAGECAVPRSGLARIDAEPEIEVDFSGANTDGKVLVRRRSRESTPTRLCSFASDVL